MHFTKNSNSRFWTIAVLLLLGSISTLNLLDNGEYAVEKKSQKIFETVKKENKIQLFVMLRNFDETSQTLKARVWFVPPDKYSNYLSDTVQAKVDTRISVAASKVDYNNGDNYGYFYERDLIGAIDIELDADNVVFQTREREDWFPFDRYSVTLNGYIDFCVEACDNEDFADNIWESLPIEIVPYTNSLPGWSSTLKIDNWVDETTEESFSKGSNFLSRITLYRTPLNIGLTFLIALIFVGGGLSMLLLFRSILMSHRPPTLSGLIWSGSTAFTMIQTRNVIPGAPRIGVKFDLFIFYPSLILCFASGGMMFYYWISKDTWSREL